MSNQANEIGEQRKNRRYELMPKTEKAEMARIDL